VDFPVATPAGQGTATHFGVWDTLTTGNLLYTGALAVSKTIAANNFLRFAAGELDITED
jgi:hypothetical protein